MGYTERPWIPFEGKMCPVVKGISVDIKFVIEELSWRDVVLDMPARTAGIWPTVKGLKPFETLRTDASGTWLCSPKNVEIVKRVLDVQYVAFITHWRLSESETLKRANFIAKVMDPVKLHIDMTDDPYNDPVSFRQWRTPTNWSKKPKPDDGEPFYGM